MANYRMFAWIEPRHGLYAAIAAVVPVSCTPDPAELEVHERVMRSKAAAELELVHMASAVSRAMADRGHAVGGLHLRRFE